MQRLFARALLPMVLVGMAACAGDAEDAGNLAEAEDTAAGVSPVDAPPPATPPAARDGLLNPETASREELMTIVGIDAALADSLSAARPYDDMTEVDAILAGSLDETRREDVYRRLWKPIDLNTATDEEILLIPGLGDRMLHEFKEYRPYQAIAQFQREIGKYVDEEEVARLQQYVEVR